MKRFMASVRSASTFALAAASWAMTACGGDSSHPADSFDCPQGAIVNVSARRLDGDDTHLQAREGEIVSVRADPDGTWSMDDGSLLVGAAGTAAIHEFVSRPEGAAFGSLVGWLSGCPDRSEQAIGLEGLLVAPCDGTLVLAANDNADPACKENLDARLGCFFDNSGEIRACVELRS